jgi:3-hydroxyacyl-[acyl-carrier-protein] dehydratase
MSDPLAIALASLPHGPEFRFLDRLLRRNPGQSGAGEYTVRGDKSFFCAAIFPASR